MGHLHHRHHKRQLSDILSEARSVVNSLQGGGDSSDDSTPTAVQASTTFASTVFQTVSGDFTEPTVGFSTFPSNPEPSSESSQQPKATQAQSSPQRQSSPQQQSTTFAQQATQQAQNSPSPSFSQQSSQQPSQQPSQSSPVTSSQINTRTSVIQLIPNVSSSSLSSPSSSSSSSFAAPSSMSSSASSMASSIVTAASATLASSISSIAAPTGGDVSSTTAVAAAATSSSSSPPPVKKGMSGGAKAGLAIGILAIIGLVAGGILFFYAKKKRQNEDFERAENEKFNASGTKPRDLALSEGEKSRANSPANAPKLSLRPVTQFLPDLNAAKKRMSNGVLGSAKPDGAGAAGDPRNLTRPAPGGSAWERRAVPVAGSDEDSNPFSDPVNPFSDKNASAPSTPTISITPPATSNGTDAAAGALGSTAVVGAADVAAARNTSDRGSPSPPRDPANSSPGDTRPGPSGASPPPTGSASPSQGENNVHRIQMDFAPSMEDELELRAGQLIKILHEYDDGWVSSLPLFKVLYD